MAKGDRVVVGDGMSFKPESGGFVMVYNIKLNQDGSQDMALDGSMGIVAAGGVKVGSNAIINGPVIKVHRSHLHNGKDYVKGIGGNDFVNMIPVFFDTYQREAYVPIDNIRLYGSFTN
jgi:hypothetical protein